MCALPGLVPTTAGDIWNSRGVPELERLRRIWYQQPHWDYRRAPIEAVRLIITLELPVLHSPNRGGEAVRLNRRLDVREDPWHHSTS
jgi:hypothetical protein